MSLLGQVVQYPEKQRRTETTGPSNPLSTTKLFIKDPLTFMLAVGLLQRDLMHRIDFNLACFQA